MKTSKKQKKAKSQKKKYYCLTLDTGGRPGGLPEEEEGYISAKSPKAAAEKAHKKYASMYVTAVYVYRDANAYASNKKALFKKKY
jgi:hypothetical protein